MLEVISADNSGGTLGSNIIPRRLLHPRGSKASFAVLRRWLEDCQQHSRCALDFSGVVVDEFPALPNRVIDVGPQSAPARLRLLETIGQRGRYVALSHCWVKQKDDPRKILPGAGKYTTTSATLQQLKNAIVFDKLLPVFQDAILVTRTLGIQYLWIDSLCIIQDSENDWAVEAKQMGLIYERACFTIAATCAYDDSEHFLRKRVLKPDMPSFHDFDPESNRVAPEMHETRPIEALINAYEKLLTKRSVIRMPCSVDSPDAGYVYFTNQPDSDARKYVERSRLNGRGWVLQERLLSRRIVHFAGDQMYWECREQFLGEDNLHHLGNRLDQESLAGIPRALSDMQRLRGRQAKPDSDIWEVDEYHEAFIILWVRMVAKYSSCGFTKNSDRAPALQGLAQRLQPLLRTTYVNGEWLDDKLPKSLLWEACGDNLPKFDEALGSTWSWISHNGPVLFPYKGLGRPQARLQAVRPPIRSESSQFRSLIIRGRLLTATFRSESSTGDEPSMLDGRTRSVYNEAVFKTMAYRRFEDSAIGTIVFDDPSAELTSVECLLLSINSRAQLIILALVRTGGDEKATVYRRVGIGNIKDMSGLACFGSDSTIILS